MISLVIPTRNRAATLRIVSGSYFSQADVDELIFVIDAGSDDTPEVLQMMATHHPDKRLLIHQNDSRKGASESRNIGVALSKNEFILFCDDDEYMEPNYARICLEKLTARGASAVSGRRVYMLGSETPQAAVARFGCGIRAIKPFNPLLCEYANGARYEGDLEMPITNAVILTRKSLLLTYPFDNFYARGNGYREETDFQMNLYVHGHKIIATNEVHSIHLPIAQVRSGGQRTSKLKRVFWSIYYTKYFYSKYFSEYAKRVGLRAPMWVALTAFSVFSVYRELLRPFVYRLLVRPKS